MDKIKENIVNVLDQFAREEMGNRLSQFAMISLKQIIFTELNKEKDNGPDTSEHTGKG